MIPFLKLLRLVYCYLAIGVFAYGAAVAMLGFRHGVYDSALTALLFGALGFSFCVLIATLLSRYIPKEKRDGRE